MADNNEAFEDAEDIAVEARRGIKEWESAYGEWTEEAKLSFAMISGDQWSIEDREAMAEQKRPLVTFNRIAAMIRGVCGLEVSQRQEVRYLAPEIGDAQSAEVQNAAAKWAREGCDAEDEESEAFRDLLTCGMGWTETRVDYDEDPEGKLIIERIDPLDARWDALASKKGLADSRWRGRVKKMSIRDLKSQWPDKADEISAYVEDTDSASIHVNRSGDDYSGGGRSSSKDEVSVIQYQYWEDRQMVKVMTLEGQTVEMPVDRANKIVESGIAALASRPYKQREYRQAIVCGPVELEDGKLNTTGFTLNCMTGMRDRNKGYWYGLVRDMIDPQKWANKFFTTFVDIIATNAKGGVMAETNAAEDPRKFEEQWSNPRSTVWLKPGGLGKIQNREAPAMPAAIPQAMEFAIGSLPHVSGINLEFLGTTNREQSGILEYHRKQSVANSLAEFFAAMRQYRKNQGRVMLELIYAFLADNRLIRIMGKQGESYVPLMRQASVKYDVVVDEAPSAPDRKMQTWMALQELLPMAMKAGLPVPPEILDYTPLPTALAMEWKKLLQNGPTLSPEQQEQMKKMQEQVQQLTDENVQLKANQAEAMAKLQIEGRQADAKMQLEERQAAHKARMDEMSAQLEERKVTRMLQLEEYKVTSQVQIAEKKTMLDAASDEHQTDTKAKSASLKFEKQDGKIQSVSDGHGVKYRIDRGADGKITGLSPQPTTIQ